MWCNTILTFESIGRHCRYYKNKKNPSAEFSAHFLERQPIPQTHGWALWCLFWVWVFVAKCSCWTLEGVIAMSTWLTDQITVTIVHFLKEAPNLAHTFFKLGIALFQDGRHWPLRFATKSRGLFLSGSSLCQILYFWICRIHIWNHWLSI